MRLYTMAETRNKQGNQPINFGQPPYASEQSQHFCSQPLIAGAVLVVHFALDCARHRQCEPWNGKCTATGFKQSPYDSAEAIRYAPMGWVRCWHVFVRRYGNCLRSCFLRSLEVEEIAHSLLIFRSVSSVGTRGRVVCVGEVCGLHG